MNWALWITDVASFIREVTPTAPMSNDLAHQAGIGAKVP